MLGTVLMFWKRRSPRVPVGLRTGVWDTELWFHSSEHTSCRLEQQSHRDSEVSLPSSVQCLLVLEFRYHVLSKVYWSLMTFQQSIIWACKAISIHWQLNHPLWGAKAPGPSLSQFTQQLCSLDLASLHIFLEIWKDRDQPAVVMMGMMEDSCAHHPSGRPSLASSFCQVTKLESN